MIILRPHRDSVVVWDHFIKFISVEIILILYIKILRNIEYIIT